MVRKGLICSIPFLIATAALAAWGWLATPEGAQVAVHWGLDGETNRYAPKPEAFLLAPGIGFLLTASFVIAPSIDPRGANMKRSAPVVLISWISGLAIVTLVQGVITLNALGLLPAGDALVPRAVGAATAIMILLLGNVLSKARPNWFVGVRTPWTLSSDKAWDVSHRWAARLFVLAGAAGLAAMALAALEVAFAVLLIGVTAAALIPTVLSYFVWRGDPERETWNA